MDIFVPQHSQKQKEKLAQLMGVSPVGLVIGDVRSELQRAVINQLERVVDGNQDRYEQYYILVHANADPVLAMKHGRRAFRTKIMILKERPPKMLGCMLFFVDNKKSDVQLEWVLPLDTVGPPGTDSGISSPVIERSAQGMPILNG
jgi:hypothetical protein